MSIDTCRNCSSYVDTDADTDCYYLEFEDGTQQELDFCLCERCRESAIERREMALAQKGEEHAN